MLAGRTTRATVSGACVGTVVAIAVWSLVGSFGLLIGPASDTWGLVAAALSGAAIGAIGLSRLLLIALGVATAGVLVVAFAPISEWISREWVRTDRLPPDGVAAVVALSASLNPDSTISGEALDHLLAALELARANRAKLLVTTTTTMRYPPGEISSVADQAAIIRMLGGSVAWLRTGVSRSTREEATGAAALLFPRGVRRIAVITSPIHTRRACATFEDVGFQVTCLPARTRDPDQQLLAQGPHDRMVAFGEWLYELAAIAKYRIHGWLR